MASKEQTEAHWLRSLIIPEILRSGKLIAAHKAGDDFTVHAIEIKFIGVDEAFMLTNCYKARIEFEHAGQRQTRTLVVKKTPEIPAEIFDSINFAALFSNEINGYTNIFPTILRFTKRAMNFPKYYYGDLQKTSATLILEDFNSDGWQMTKERANLSLEHVLLAVKYLATFHGIGYAMKQQDRKLFDSITADLKESRFATESLHPDWDLTQRIGIKRVIAVTRRYQPEVATEFVDKLERLISDCYRYGKQRVQPLEPMATLCHGDYLRNNVAYKYEQGTQRPIDVMMFDLQTMRYSSPMVDLTVFLALSAFKEVRSEHFQEIFNTYCQQLATTYAEHAREELPQFLSYDSLLKEYIRFLPYSIAVAASFLMTLVDPGAMSSEQMLQMQQSPEDLERDTMQRGGETVDRELAHQAKELYELSTKYQLDICEGIEI